MPCDTSGQPTTPLAITAGGLRKSFGDHVVLDAITLDVAKGTAFALLGPNGAGKTTMVQILSTLIRADAGKVRVAGYYVARDADAVRAAIGVTGQFSAVDGLLTGTENLTLMADLAMTLVRTPRVIFLDEPTTGLDPRSRHTMWGIIRQLVADRVTVFLTTQYLEEADQLTTASGSWIRAGSSRREPQPSSSVASPVATSDCGSPLPVTSRRPSPADPS